MDPEARPRVPVWLRLLAGLGVLGLLFGAVLLWIMPLGPDKTRVLIVNGAAVPAESLLVSVSYSGAAAPPHTIRGDSFAPGEGLTFQPRTYDVDVSLSFT